jgi:hypothetical protein
LFQKRKSVNEQGYDEWSYLVRGLSIIEETDENQERRLEEELAFIKETGIADFFWFIYTSWEALYYNGGGYLMGDMETFYCLYYLSIVKENTLNKPFNALFLKNGLPKLIFCVAKGKTAWFVDYLQKTYGNEVEKMGDGYGLASILQIEIIEKVGI